MEKPSFEDLVREHYRFIQGTLYCLRVRANDVDDVAQEVLWGAYRGLAKFDPAVSRNPDNAVALWLLGICEKQAANYRRAKRSRREDPRANGELDHLKGASPNGEDACLKQEVRARLDRILSDLEPARRELIIAYELDDTPMRDVARQQGIPINTAWNRLRLARADIKAAWLRARRRKKRKS